MATVVNLSLENKHFRFEWRLLRDHYFLLAHILHCWQSLLQMYWLSTVEILIGNDRFIVESSMLASKP